MELLEIVFIMGILLLIFGPKKLPELARELGEAIYEFRKASSSMVKPVKSPSVTKTPTDISSAIEDVAKELNIKTEGKTIKQVTQEIITKIENKNVER